MQKIILFYELVGKRKPNLKAIAGKLKRVGFERINAGGRLIAMAKGDRLIIIDYKGKIVGAARSDSELNADKTKKNMDNMIRKLPHSLGVRDVGVDAAPAVINADFERIINDFFNDFVSRTRSASR